MEDRDDVLVEINGGKYIPDSLESVCHWWMLTYPEDIFVENPKEVVEIRDGMKKLLQQLDKKYNHLFVSSQHHPFFVDEVIVLKEAINDIISDPETKRRIYNSASELMEKRENENK